MEEENGRRGRSFRYEDYNNRRVFLRSYPLHLEDEDEQEQCVESHEMVKIFNKGGKINLLKQRVVCVLRWGEAKVLCLRKLKHKLSFYLVSCHPFGRKPSPSLLSV